MKSTNTWKQNDRLHIGWQEAFAARLRGLNLMTPSVYVSDKGIIMCGQDLDLPRNIYVPLMWMGLPVQVYHYNLNGGVAIGWGASTTCTSSIAIGTSAKMVTPTWNFGK